MTEDNEVITWEEVEKAAKSMFKVWFDGGELAWAQECWQHFTKAGLTTGATLLERTATYMRLVTLAHCYEQFSRMAWDEDPETPLELLSENLDIESIPLGVLASQLSMDWLDEYDDEHELREAAMKCVVSNQAPELCACLSQAYGGSYELYARIMSTVDNPFADEWGNALNFVMDGFEV